jgi:hypothetical protein
VVLGGGVWTTHGHGSRSDLADAGGKVDTRTALALRCGDGVLWCVAVWCGAAVVVWCGMV